MSRDHEVRWWRTDLGDDEIAAVATAIRSRKINQGPECEAFERELAAELGVRHSAVTTSGSVALLLALKACGVGRGTEVVVPALTFIAPAHAAIWLDATVRLADVGAERPVVDADTIERAITDRTVAVVCAHLNGRAVDVEGIRARLAGRPIAIIEDCAQALASKSNGKALGSMADVAAFSFSISKLITTGGEGGLVVTNESERYDRLLRLRNQGVRRIADNVFDEVGFNFRLTDLQAAIGRSQLAKLDAKLTSLRRLYRRYRDGLVGVEGVRLLDVDLEAGEVPLWVEVLCRDRDRWAAGLRRRGIESKAFHPCLSESPHLQVGGSYPNAQRFAAQGLILPSGPDQSDADVERVIAALREIAVEETGTTIEPASVG